MHDNLIILAGGASSRMNASLQQENPSGTSKSKALIGVDEGDRPFLDYLLNNAKKASYRNVILVVGEHADEFKKCYGAKTKNSDFNGLNITYAIQYIPKERTKPWGTADALFQALEHYPHLKNETFTVCNSDNLYSVEAFSSLKNSTDNNAFIAYDRQGLNFTMERISRFALVLLDAENYLRDIVEKPSADKIDSYKDQFGKYRVSMNIFKLYGKDIYPFLRDCPVHLERNEKELPTAVLNMCQSSLKAMKGIPFSEHVPDLTSKEDISVLKSYIQDHFKS